MPTSNLIRSCLGNSSVSIWNCTDTSVPSSMLFWDEYLGSLLWFLILPVTVYSLKSTRLKREMGSVVRNCLKKFSRKKNQHSSIEVSHQGHQRMTWTSKRKSMGQPEMKVLECSDIVVQWCTNCHEGSPHPQIAKVAMARKVDLKQVKAVDALVCPTLPWSGSGRYFWKELGIQIDCNGTISGLQARVTAFHKK
jgi:hypothetical protein